jgi:hypothetical protein
VDGHAAPVGLSGPRAAEVLDDSAWRRPEPAEETP